MALPPAAAGTCSSDLTDCLFLDSTVITALLNTQFQVTARDGRFGLVVPPGSSHTARVIQTMCVGEAMPIYGSLEEGIVRAEWTALEPLQSE